MTLIKHELKKNRISTLIWTATLSVMLAICIFIYPEMKGEMEELNDVFASMGSFTQAFGMDQISFGTLLGYYATECGNVLGLGGAIFAALTAVAILAREEKNRTAEFLLTHPICRFQVVTDKLIAVLVQITAMNVIVYAFSVLSVVMIGETVPWKEATLLHLAYLLLQYEIAAICFGLSAFLHRGSLGVGIGIAVTLYFLSLVANITESAEFLNYITPFGYANGADIVSDAKLDGVRILIGMVYASMGIVVAYWKYSKKDIA